MNFKHWIEAVELNQPVAKVTRSNVTLGKGTNSEQRAIQYFWKTNKGNIIKLRFIPQGNDKYQIVFYVNDTLKDDATKSSKRDIEVLSNVWFLIKNKADDLQAQELSFTAYTDDDGRDVTNVKNLDYKEQINIVKKLLIEFYSIVKNHNAKEVPLSSHEKSLYDILNLGSPPESTEDFDKNKWLRWCASVAEFLKGPESLNNTNLDFSNLLRSEEQQEFKPLNYNKAHVFYEELKKLHDYYLSNTEYGWHRRRNRRKNIYEKIVNRYFSDDWDIKIGRDDFHLKRKSNIN